MIYLLLGLIVLFGVHAVSLARGFRAAAIDHMGEVAYKTVYSILSLLGLALIVYGYGIYRASGYIPVWNPPVFLRHIALLLMLPSMILLVAAYAPASRIKAAVKHPMLNAVKLWALAHLLANGDLGSIVLFVALLAYAVVDRIAVKRRGDAPPPAPQGWTGDAVALVGGTAFYVVFAFWLHPILIGVPVVS